MSTDLKSFVESIFSNQEDFFVKHLFAEYGERFGEMVRALEINQRTIHPGLVIIAEEMLTHPFENYHVYTFLVFCMEIERHCKVHHYTWFTHEKLVEIIADILQTAGYIPTPTPTPGRRHVLGGIQCTVI